eukprot:5854274-Amphidinium_carterae.2
MSEPLMKQLPGDSSRFDPLDRALGGISERPAEVTPEKKEIPVRTGRSYHHPQGMSYVMMNHRTHISLQHWMIRSSSEHFGRMMGYVDVRKSKGEGAQGFEDKEETHFSHATVATYSTCRISN